MDLGTDTLLVTGAAGWLGRGLLSALVGGLPDCPSLAEPARDVAIRAFDLAAGEAAVHGVSHEITYVAGDVRKPDDCVRLCEGARGAILFHLAGVIHPRWSRQFKDVNYRGTQNVLASAVSAGVRRAVIMSSNSPIGCNPHDDHLFDEASPYDPYMGYGRSKMLMEKHVAGVQAAGKIETVTIRAPWFYGPFQPARQTTFFTMIRDGKAPIVGGGENRRSMAYIDNLAQGLILAAVTPGANGQVYWIADERPYTMNEIVDTVERLLEDEFGQRCAHKRLRLPGLASRIAWLADWLMQAAGLYHQKVHVLSEMNKTIACSAGKAKRELGYQPTVALEEGMRRSLRAIDASRWSDS